MFDGTADVAINPFRENLPPATRLDRANLAGQDEEFGLGQPIAEHLRNLGGRVPLPGYWYGQLVLIPLERSRGWLHRLSARGRGRRWRGRVPLRGWWRNRCPDSASR